MTQLEHHEAGARRRLTTIVQRASVVRLALGFTLCSVMALGSVSVSALELRGTLKLQEKGKAVTEYDGVVMYYTPREAVPTEPLEEIEIVTVRKQFQPRVTAVTPGTTVRFPNQDAILHNVFSVSGKNRFDLGFYKRGDEGKEAELLHPGVVRVFCNVHHEMVAYVVVVETPFMAYPDAQGNFELTDLPAGEGTLTIWHERAAPVELAVRLPLAAPVAVDVTLTRPRVPKHTNKFGKSYKRRKRGKAYN